MLGSVLLRPGHEYLCYSQRERQIPYYQNWTVEGACNINTCPQENQENPDIAGIGVGLSVMEQKSQRYTSANVVHRSLLPT